MKNMLVFISSTFADMEDTRKRLVNNVFKGLEEYAADRGIRLGVVDLVWGIPDAGPGTQAEIIRRCLDLVDEARPHFLSLIGNRYGWTPARDTLDALASGEDRPEDGTSVTALEIFRFFAASSTTEDGPKGLFILKNGGEDDSPRLDGLRTAIRDHPRACVHDVTDISPDNIEMLAGIQSFYQARIDELAEVQTPTHRFPTQMLGRMLASPDQFEEGGAWLTSAAGNEEDRSIVLVDGPDDIARVSFIDALCRQWREANPAGTYEQIHAGAQGILSYNGLIKFLTNVNALADQPVDTPRLIAIDGLEDMPVWHAPEDTRVEGKYLLFGHIWTAESNGVSWILGADYQKRPALLEGLESKGWLPGCKVVSLNSLDSGQGDIISQYFHRFGKEVSVSQIDLILGSITDNRFSPTESLLLCDRIRRIGSVNRNQDVTSQEHFLYGQISAILPDSPESLYAAVVAELREQFGGRQGVAMRALSLICASAYGVSLADVQNSCQEHSGGTMTVMEWSLLRAVMGPLLVGTVGRIRIADERARGLIAVELGESFLGEGRTQLLQWLFHKVSNLTDLVELADMNSALANELPELISNLGWDSPYAAEFFDPSIFLSWAIYDPSLLAYQFYLLVEDALPSGALEDAAFRNHPWRGIDRLCALIAGTDFESEEGKRIVATMDHALGDMDFYPGSVEFRSDSFGARAIACIYAGMRGRVVMRTMLGQGQLDTDQCLRALSSASDWANRLSRIGGISATDLDRCWYEVAAWLLTVVDNQEGYDEHDVSGRLMSLGMLRREQEETMPSELRNAADLLLALHFRTSDRKLKSLVDDPAITSLRHWLQAHTGIPDGPGQAVSILGGRANIEAATGS